MYLTKVDMVFSSEASSDVSTSQILP